MQENKSEEGGGLIREAGTDVDLGDYVGRHLGRYQPLSSFHRNPTVNVCIGPSVRTPMKDTGNSFPDGVIGSIYFSLPPPSLWVRLCILDETHGP